MSTKWRKNKDLYNQFKENNKNQEHPIKQTVNIMIYEYKNMKKQGSLHTNQSKQQKSRTPN